MLEIFLRDECGEWLKVVGMRWGWRVMLNIWSVWCDCITNWSVDFMSSVKLNSHYMLEQQLS